MPHGRLAIVTGKGGVGKTTVALGLARAAVRRGLDVLIAEMASPGRLASALGVDDIGFMPCRIQPGLSAVHLDDAKALEELVDRLLPLKLLSRRLFASGTFRTVAAAVPGIVETALLAAVTGWTEERRGLGRGRYDLVILDAPASGHTLPLLTTPRTLAGLASVGPLAEIVRRTSRLLADRSRTALLVVATPQDWAVVEALDLYRTLRDDLGAAVAAPILNATFPRRFSPRDADLIARATADSDPERRALAAARHFIARRAEATEASRALASGAGIRAIELPYLFSATLAWDGMNDLAAALDVLFANGAERDASGAAKTTDGWAEHAPARP